MCGICGNVALSSLIDPEATRLRVEAMLQSLAHRGPDDVGQMATESAVLGVTRLAIRGLSDANQPMVDAASGVLAVCNGEIDNHRELRRWLAERGRRCNGKRTWRSFPVFISNWAKHLRASSSAHSPLRCGIRATGGSLWHGTAPGNVRCFTRCTGAKSFLPPRSPRWWRTAGCR